MPSLSTTFTAAVVAGALALSGCAGLRQLAGDIQGWRSDLNPSPPERRVVEGLETACARGSIVWIVPAADGDGVVLVDAGFDESGESIRAVLGKRRVRAVLLTHGHLDHRSAAHLFGAPVYVGRADRDIVTGEHGADALFSRVGDGVGVPPEPKALLPVDDGEVLVVGGTRFTAVALPGHTRGSTGWLMGKRIFTGDAIQGPLGDGELWPAPWYVTDDMRAAYGSIAKLAFLDVETVLDGHFGRTDDAANAARRAARRVHREEALYEHPMARPDGCGSAPPARTAPAAPLAHAARAAPTARR